ncbi:MAG TPA: hypothetical protein VFZ42_08010 [Chitinophagaceae bacterium]
MKKLLFPVLVLMLLSSCTYHSHRHTGKLPPGQVKKVTGSKSAKAYAPGQQKKKY